MRKQTIPKRLISAVNASGGTFTLRGIAAAAGATPDRDLRRYLAQLVAQGYVQHAVPWEAGRSAVYVRAKPVPPDLELSARQRPSPPLASRLKKRIKEVLDACGAEDTDKNKLDKIRALLEETQ